MNQIEPLILVVDDIKTNILFMETCLEKAGLTRTLPCRDSSKVLDLLCDHSVDLILLDLRMPPPDGITLLPLIRKQCPEIPVIIITDVSDVKTAVACMREGAFDYITKPVDQDLFTITIQRALSFRYLTKENSDLKKTVHTLHDLKHPECFKDMITQSPSMFRIFQYMEAVAESPASILITGETGVGKERVTQIIHTLSKRPGKLVPVNVAGLDDSMFSDTLFGHIPGAFTGAEKIRKGLIETAENGTLFLDEIGDLSPISQVKLLRLLQENEYMPLGSDAVKQSTARIIVATNEDLTDLQNKGKFRKDLIFRLKTHHIHLPPLSERKQDIPLLLDHFIRMAGKRLNIKISSVSEGLYKRLSAHPFPGNVRELKAMAFDAVSQCRNGELSVDHFGRHLLCETVGPTKPGAFQAHDDELLRFPDRLPTLKEITDALVAEALKRAKGKQTLAASMLGISQPALNKRINKQPGGIHER